MQDPNVRLFRLEVQATDGTVTILREMGDEAIRGEIEAIVRTTAGVKSVTIVPGE
jgi:osmotically-inducible protein OsmY